MTTLQYTTTQSFIFGLATTDVDTETYITEPYRTFEVSIELSDTLGGGNRVPFNKNITKYSTDGPGYTSKGTSIMYNVDDDYRDYCNGKIVNKSSGSATVRIIVVRNFDINDVIDLWG